MASSWVLKTRQGSEAGKEILLREALTSHMRSTRDRQLFSEILSETQPLEDVFSFFASFYLHSYQGVRLLKATESSEHSPEQGTDGLGQEERRQLELEVRQLFANKQREEIDTSRILSELTIECCDEFAGTDSSTPEIKEKIIALVKEFLKKIPSDYTPNHDVDLILEITGWGPQWRDELYTKASGLKESAMTLREELLREHPSEVPETTVLKFGLEHIYGRVEYAKGRLINAVIPARAWESIADAISTRFCKPPDNLRGLRIAHSIRLGLLDVLEEDFDIPTTIEDYENRLGNYVTGPLSDILAEEPTLVLDILSNLLQISEDDIRAQLRRKGISDFSVIADGLKSLTETTESSSGPQVSKEEMEMVERSLKTLEKLENTMNRPVKGMLRSRGLNAMELDKITLDLLIKDRDSLLGIELEVLDELKKKMRVPPPQEVTRLLEIREQVQSGALSNLGISSARDFSQQRVEEETTESIRLDIIWHFTTSILTNLTRVVESYIRSKQDLLRIKALLKSIYEDTDTTLQYLREEILIDLASMRVYELKIVHPELDATSICTWMHARLSSKDMMAAGKDLENTPSPVFEGIIDKPLLMDNLEFDNYAIAYDVMQRFLKQERLEKLAKEEYAFEAKEKEARAIESKRIGIDVLMYLQNKAATVFRAISRVGTKGLEWTQSDTSKCSNLLSYYIKSNRGRLICTACGTVAQEGTCAQHKKSFIKEANDIENLSIFIMSALFEIKDGLIGAGRGAEPMPWDKAKSTIDREIAILKRKGKLTSKSNLKELLPGDINYVIGPALSAVIGKYFNESLVYAARRADIA
jgi:hypothetical protein